MANQAIKKIIAYEKIYGRKKTAANTLVMALRYYMGFCISNQRDFLHKANFVLSFYSDSPDISISLFRMHIAHEMEHVDMMEDIAAKLKPYRNTLKNQDPNLYAHYLYFACVLAIAKDKERAANKHYRALSDYCKEYKPKNGDLLLAAANCAFTEYEDALTYLYNAYREGEISPLFYICLGRALEHCQPNGAQSELLLPMIKWGLNSGYYISGIITKNRNLVEVVLRKNINHAEGLYKLYPMDWILSVICMRRMINNDLSNDAFFYYNEAHLRQLHFVQLYDFLVRSAHKNGIENISRYCIKQYLKTTEAPPMEILPFVYHMAIMAAAQSQDNEFLEKIKYDIIQCACFAIENRMYGRHYYSIYNFTLKEAISGEKLDKKIMDTLEHTLKNILFTHEVSFANDIAKQKKILVQEEYRQSDAIYDTGSGRLRLLLCNSAARVVAFDNGFTSILDDDPKIQKLVENVDISVLQYFFDKGQRNLELIVSLCLNYIKAEVVSQKAMKAFAAALDDEGISQNFKARVLGAMGNYHAANRNYIEAAQCYKDMGQVCPDTANPEQMLLTYIHGGKLDMARELITKKGVDIEDKNLFHAIKRVALMPEEGGGQKAIAAKAYEQLLRGWYDKGLLDLVLKSHVSGLFGWIELSKSLMAIGITEAALYAKILSIAIEIQNCDKAVQGIFAKFMQDSPQSPILQDFLGYICYEVIVNGLKPEYESIYAMEAAFDAGDAFCNDNFLAYALAHVYIKDAVTTKKSFDILSHSLQAARQDDIIWPIFKEIKDKTMLVAYIEKNTPFIYRGKAANVVTFHYKTADNDEYVQIPAKYLRFGIYTCHVPHFYGEEIEYYFQEAIGASSITTLPQKIKNNKAHALENQTDLYYIINNALVFEQMFKYDKVEEIVTAKLAEKQPIRAKML